MYTVYSCICTCKTLYTLQHSGCSGWHHFHVKMILGVMFFFLIAFLPNYLLEVTPSTFTLVGGYRKFLPKKNYGRLEWLHERDVRSVERSNVLNLICRRSILPEPYKNLFQIVWITLYTPSSRSHMKWCSTHDLCLESRHLVLTMHLRALDQSNGSSLLIFCVHALAHLLSGGTWKKSNWSPWWRCLSWFYDSTGWSHGVFFVWFQSCWV